MLAWLKRVGLISAVLFGIVFAVGLLLPTEFTVERTTQINATPETIHHYVGDLARWSVWSPWQAEDPSIETELGDRTSGLGAHQSWTSESGDGEITFTKVDEQTGIEYDLVFKEGDARLVNLGYIRYRPKGDSTEVIWGMKGDLEEGPLGLSGYFAVTMDPMLGGMFERGLAKLKQATESPHTGNQGTP